MISSIISRLIILVFGTLYPAYASYKAVRTKNVKEYVKWMMYWIVFALFTCAETFTDVFCSFWFPFYYEIKVILVLWLLSPATKGSSILYRKFVHPMLTKREQEIDEYIAKAKEQGYHTVLTLGSKGVNYATTVIMQTAIKGGGGLVNQLRRSYSLSDISADMDALAEMNRIKALPEDELDIADTPLPKDARLRRSRGYSPRRSASGSGRVEMYFPEVDVNVRQRGARPRETGIPLSHIRSNEDVSSGYSSAEMLYSGHPPVSEAQEPLVRTSSVGSSRVTRTKVARGGAIPKKPSAAEDNLSWSDSGESDCGIQEHFYDVTSSPLSEPADILPSATISQFIPSHQTESDQTESYLPVTLEDLNKDVAVMPFKENLNVVHNVQDITNNDDVRLLQDQSANVSCQSNKEAQHSVEERVKVEKMNLPESMSIINEELTIVSLEKSKPDETESTVKEIVSTTDNSKLTSESFQGSNIDETDKGKLEENMEFTNAVCNLGVVNEVFEGQTALEAGSLEQELMPYKNNSELLNKISSDSLTSAADAHGLEIINGDVVPKTLIVNSLSPPIDSEIIDESGPNTETGTKQEVAVRMQEFDDIEFFDTESEIAQNSEAGRDNNQFTEPEILKVVNSVSGNMNDYQPKNSIIPPVDVLKTNELFGSDGQSHIPTTMYCEELKVAENGNKDLSQEQDCDFFDTEPDVSQNTIALIDPNKVISGTPEYLPLSMIEAQSDDKDVPEEKIVETGDETFKEARAGRYHKHPAPSPPPKASTENLQIITAKDNLESDSTINPELHLDKPLLMREKSRSKSPHCAHHTNEKSCTEEVKNSNINKSTENVLPTEEAYNKPDTASYIEAQGMRPSEYYYNQYRSQASPKQGKRETKSKQDTRFFSRILSKPRSQLASFFPFFSSRDVAQPIPDAMTTSLTSLDDMRDQERFRSSSVAGILPTSSGHVSPLTPPALPPRRKTPEQSDGGARLNIREMSHSPSRH